MWKNTEISKKWPWMFANFFKVNDRNLGSSKIWNSIEQWPLITEAILKCSTDKQPYLFTTLSLWLHCNWFSKTPIKLICITYRFNQTMETDEWYFHAWDVRVEDKVGVQDPIFPGLILERHYEKILSLARSQDNCLERAQGEKLGGVWSQSDTVYSHLKVEAVYIREFYAVIRCYVISSSISCQ